MKITLCDLNSGLCAEWQRAFVKCKEVSVESRDIFTCGAFDAIVYPGNSYGFVNNQFTKYFGEDLQRTIQDQIKARPMRELLVGETLVISTGNKNIPNLIVAPIMRVPLDVSDTANIYLAFRAALLAGKAYDFKSIICPGLGTLTGNVSPTDASHQMYEAYFDTFTRYPRYPNSIDEAYRDHISLVGVLNIKNKGRR